MLDDARMFLRFAGGLHRFLSTPLSWDDCRRMLEELKRERDRTFLLVMERAVYTRPESPYRKLLAWAGVELGDLRTMVAQEGVEGTLRKLLEAGVYLHFEEFKGKRPIQRPGLEIEVSAEDFDNPLLAREFELATGGSGGKRRRLNIDFDQIKIDAVGQHAMTVAHDVADYPEVLWRPVPPGGSGIRNALMRSKMGGPVDFWFTPNSPAWGAEPWKSVVFQKYAVAASRWTGYPLQAPVHVPVSEPAPVVRELARFVQAGTPGRLDAPVSSCLRAATFAMDHGLDLSGSWFRMGGEPLTAAKAEIFARAGVRTCVGWTLSECGRIGFGCARPEVPDEVHLWDGKMAVLPRNLDLGLETVQALHLTTLSLAAPKLMLNLESGDYGTFTDRRCGCLLEELGMARHIHTIRSYEKLTAGGMQFLGSDLLALIDEALPARFGGGPTDYQFIEEESEGRTVVRLLIHPDRGLVDERAAVELALASLGGGSRGQSMMAEHWRSGEMLSVARAVPETNNAGKTPPLIVRKK